MKKIHRYMVQGAVAPVHLADHGLCILHSDYVQDVNERLEMIARAITADERGEDGITPTASAVRALKVAPE